MQIKPKYSLMCYHVRCFWTEYQLRCNLAAEYETSIEELEDMTVWDVIDRSEMAELFSFKSGFCFLEDRIPANIVLSEN